jgi:chemotaxis protein MotA
MAALLIFGGLAVAFGSAIGGFVMGHGNPQDLVHPAEILIIVGIATSIVLLSSPFPVLMRLVADVLQAIKGVDMSKERFCDLLKLLYEILQVGRRKGYIAMDEHISDPKGSAIFGKYKTFLADQAAVDFLCAALRPLVDGKVKPDQIDAILATELSTKKTEAKNSSDTLLMLQDSMPGVGIVAALMGVINALGKMDDPEQLVHTVAAALSGTFLGIFSAYAVFGPMGVLIKHNNAGKFLYFEVIRVSIAGFAKGLAPAMAVDVARRALTDKTQPSGEELEELIKSIKAN